MTNYEKIKSMSVEEMAKTIDHYKNGCDSCPYDWDYEKYHGKDEEWVACDKCVDSIKEWLESEVIENEI